MDRHCATVTKKSPSRCAFSGCTEPTPSRRRRDRDPPGPGPPNPGPPRHGHGGADELRPLPVLPVKCKFNLEPRSGVERLGGLPRDIQVSTIHSLFQVVIMVSLSAPASLSASRTRTLLPHSVAKWHGLSRACLTRPKRTPDGPGASVALPARRRPRPPA